MRKRKYVAVLGGGESGTGTALLAKQKGYGVFLSDSGKIKPKYKSVLENEKILYEEGKHSPKKILLADFVIKSPGIPESTEIIKAIRKDKIKIYSEIEFASWFTDVPIVAITGTNGKTTTTNLTYHIMKQGGMNVTMAGNVGNSFAEALTKKKSDAYVLEISNFQLDDIEKFKPHVSVLLNITPDHLDRYNYDFQEYVDSKFRVAENQDENDYFIYNADDEIIIRELKRKKIRAQKIPLSIEKKNTSASGGAFIDKNQLTVQLKKKQFTMYTKNLALLGKHNLYNSLASAVAANIMDIRKESVRQSLADYKNVEHRLEFVCTIHGVSFINDSKATNVNSAWYALECTESPVVWIAGGIDKGNDYSKLMPLVEKKVKGIVCLGIDNKKIHQAFGTKVPLIVNTTEIEEAVRVSFYVAHDRGTVLLSPACASFDLFENYEDRGRQFKKAVRSL